MSIAALIREMASVGAPPEAIALAVEAIEAAQAQIESRRATERARKRRQRERDKDGTVTGQSRDSHGHVPDTPSPPCPPLKSPPDPQKITPPISPHPSVVARTKFAPPDGVSIEQWEGFLRLRSAKRQPMTDRGYSLLCGKLEASAEHGFPPGLMIDTAIERGWTTVHEPKDQRNGHMGRHQSANGISATVSAAIDVFGLPDAGDERRVPQRADQVPRLGGPGGHG